MVISKKITYCIILLSIFSSVLNASLEVYCGSMCSGKSEELIRFVSRQVIANPKIIGVFKPLLDNRVLQNNEKDPSRYIMSRNGGSVACISVNTIEEIEQIIASENYEIIVIDEAQFFPKDDLIKFVKKMLALKKRIVIFGLDLDFRGETFGAMGELMALADHVVKLTAICSCCGIDIYCITQRIVDGKPAHYNDPLIIIGDQQYEPRCRNCHVVRKD